MKLLRPSLLICMLFVLGGVMFKITAPRICGTIVPGDAVFVLTGDARRIPFAARIVANYPGTELYIIGAGDAGASAIAPRATIESESKSTYQNARAINEIATANQLYRIILVTTEDHMNRAQHLVQHELPGREVVACPVPLAGMPVTKRLERWTIEYIKYIVTLVGIKESF